ncbi:DUF502 domain-containing protein [Phaeodactylibacter xiamenensis]|jgi:uncharacterized membrane protein|uniref:DUF502 domain-containing protein n=1 Tax=Phaeodactylibacter xiamenensis TaxID=1524460 RepID=A0A098RZR8_9BACT|nr:DUF502 domain-containing protein [Phaeodactylibacter xiamenensis]KGE85088.1 hypothetical protein IX84_29785 [Phaeodactylibacter xiamenensis]MCR9051289.1 DUF502 domain-containing protein [bacterium]
MIEPSEKVRRRSRRFMRIFNRLRRFFATTFIGGLVVILPLTLFFFLVRILINFMTNLVSPVRALIPFSEELPGWFLDFLALSIVLTFFFALGLVVRTSSGSKMFTQFEQRWLMSLPFYGVLRETVRQFLGRKKVPFSQVVLVDPFGSGTLMTGFVTDDELGNGYVTVFVPTGPNPTNGFVFHMKEEDVKYVNTRPEDAMRSIISVGAGSSSLFDLPEAGKAVEGDTEKELPSSHN